MTQPVQRNELTRPADAAALGPWFFVRASEPEEEIKLFQYKRSLTGVGPCATREREYGSGVFLRALRCGKFREKKVEVVENVATPATAAYNSSIRRRIWFVVLQQYHF